MITHDPQLVTETEVAIILEAGTLRMGLDSLYYEGDKEIEPYLERTKAACIRAIFHRDTMAAQPVAATNKMYTAL
jgi:hypothetical protein